MSAVLAAFIVVFATFTFLFPKILVPSEGFDKDLEQARVANRVALLQSLAGFAIFAGAVAAWRQLQLGRQQLFISQQGQITERFTQAIEQLGHKEEDVRLGGIYALEQISKTSENERAAVLEVLTAYVRGHSPWPPRLDEQPAAEESIDHVLRLRDRAPAVQAAMNVIGRHAFLSEPLQLMGADLRRLRLAAPYMPGGANLEGARLWRTHLEDATLDSANLRGAFLGGADLSKSHMHKAVLEGALINEGANLDQADLSGANLREANLADSRNIVTARLSGAVANSKTRWPEGFDWAAAGVIMEAD
jgi:hypothetical protein